jgi:hypothetical protein
MALRIRRGTDAERQTVVFAEGELVYTTDTKELYIGDGATFGGILVSQTEDTPTPPGGITSIVEDTSPQLGGNLDLNNREIFGVGSIDITGPITADVINSGLFVGDGSGLTNIPGVDGIVDGSNYFINIIGSDSSLLVDAANNQINAVNVFSDAVNTENVFITGSTLDFQYSDTGNLNPVEVIITSNENRSLLKFNRNSNSDLANNPNVEYGSIVFGRNDLNGPLNTSLIIGTENTLFFGNNPLGTFATEDFYFVWRDNKLGVKKLNPEKELDVNGEAIIRGDLSLENGSILLEPTTDVLNIVNPVKGQFSYDNVSENLSFYDGGTWYNLVKTEYLTNFTVLEGPLSIGKATTTERDFFGDDSTLLSGGLFYNSTEDRFQFFQAGSWVSLPNNGSDVGQVLVWNGTEWTATDPSVVSGTVQNADLLDGFSGSFYLDYNNFTNTPTLPDGLSSRAALNGSTGSISDGTSANVNITGYKGYMLYKIETSDAAWVRLYVSDAARTADASRTQGQDPLPGSGVIAEVITTGAETVIIAPGVIGFNNESPVTNVVPVAVTNLSGGSADITVTLTAVEMEV